MIYTVLIIIYMRLKNLRVTSIRTFEIETFQFSRPSFSGIPWARALEKSGSNKEFEREVGEASFARWKEACLGQERGDEDCRSGASSRTVPLMASLF